MPRWLPAAASAGLGLAIVLTIAIGKWRPFVDQQRPVVSSTPGVPGLTVATDVRIPSGKALCVRPVEFDADTARARFVVADEVRASNVSVTLKYRRRLTRPLSPMIASGQLTAQFRAPGQRVSGTICVRNVGRHAFSLVGTTEARSLGVADAYVGGQRQLADVALTLMTSRDTSVAGQFRRAATRASTLSGGFLPPWVISALLAVLAAVVVGLFAVFFVVTARSGIARR